MISISFDTRFMRFGKGIECRLRIAFGNLTCDNRIIIPKDESILFRLILDDAELGIHVILHFIIVPIQMIGRNVQQNCDICLEVIHVIQLEATQLDDIDIMRRFSHL